MSDDAIDPVRVHLTSSDISLSPPPLQQRMRYTTQTRIVRLTLDDAVQLVADQDLNRVELWIQPLDFDIVLCHSNTQAKDSGNSPVASNATPNGAVIPKTNTQMNGPFKGQDAMWIACVNNASPYPNRVSVIITRCIPDGSY